MKVHLQDRGELVLCSASTGLEERYLKLKG